MSGVGLLNWRFYYVIVYYHLQLCLIQRQVSQYSLTVTECSSFRCCWREALLGGSIVLRFCLVNALVSDTD
jgi:hypothetical protein